jgi:hypothetical protein
MHQMRVQAEARHSDANTGYTTSARKHCIAANINKTAIRHANPDTSEKNNPSDAGGASLFGCKTPARVRVANTSSKAEPINQTADSNIMLSKK